MPVKGILWVNEKNHKFYVCRKCKTPCYICITGEDSQDGVPRPDRCPYKRSDKPDCPSAIWDELKED